MTCSSQIIGEVLPDIHTTENCDFLKSEKANEISIVAVRLSLTMY